MASRQVAQSSLFFNELAYAARDACWYVRDNLQSMLANEWDSLRDLAYEGSREFVPLLHQLGLPAIDAETQALTQALIAEGERYRLSIPQKTEEATQKAGLDAPAPAQAEQAEKAKLAFEEEQAKPIVLS
jgi:hypothetical protein